MKYRKFGSLEWKALALSRTAGLPYVGKDPEAIDAEASIELIRSAIDHGINYLDLGYPYDLKRQERIAGIVGDALADGYRGKVRISVTLPSHLIRNAQDFEFYLGTQLGWLRTAKADFCLFGRLNRNNWPMLQKLGALAWADAALNSQEIEYIGFSFHDHFQIFKSILFAYDRWALCQFQFSYMDVEHDPALAASSMRQGEDWQWLLPSR